MPHTLTPFRYPGGKTQLYDFVNHTLEINNIKHGTYVEPFAGGSGISIKLLANHDVENIWMNDYDPSIFSVWYAILNSPSELISLLMTAPFDYSDTKTDDTKNIEFWKNVKTIHETEKHNPYSIQNAFSTLFLNRTNRSGIITGGPVGGFTQANIKISSRYNKETLKSKIEAIYAMRDHITLTNFDSISNGDEFKSLDTSSTFIFFDPPYFNQGSNLYYSSFDEIDHIKMRETIESLSNYKSITTYDNTNEIKDIYNGFPQKYEYSLNYSANNKRRGKFKEVMFANSNTKLESFNKVRLEKYSINEEKILI